MVIDVADRRQLVGRSGQEAPLGMVRRAEGPTYGNAPWKGKRYRSALVKEERTKNNPAKWIFLKPPRLENVDEFENSPTKMATVGDRSCRTRGL